MKLFTQEDGTLLVDPFLRCLRSFDDSYIKRQAAVVLAHLLSEHPEPEAASTLLAWVLRQIRLHGAAVGRRQTKHAELGSAVAALAVRSAWART